MQRPELKERRSFIHIELSSAYICGVLYHNDDPQCATVHGFSSFNSTVMTYYINMRHVVWYVYKSEREYFELMEVVWPGSTTKPA